MYQALKEGEKVLRTALKVSWDGVAAQIRMATEIIQTLHSKPNVHDVVAPVGVHTMFTRVVATTEDHIWTEFHPHGPRTKYKRENLWHYAERGSDHG